MSKEDYYELMSNVKYAIEQTLEGTVGDPVIELVVDKASREIATVARGYGVELETWG